MERSPYRLRQSIESGAHDVLDAGREIHVRGSHPAHLLLILAQHAALQHRPDDLLDEEWITLGLLPNQLREVRRHLGRLEEIGHHRVHFRWFKQVETDLGKIGPVGPA